MPRELFISMRKEVFRPTASVPLSGYMERLRIQHYLDRCTWHGRLILEPIPLACLGLIEPSIDCRSTDSERTCDIGLPKCELFCVQKYLGKILRITQ